MNPVLYWNAILLEASRRDFTRGFNNAQQPGPIRTSRAMAMVHIAIHDVLALKTNPAASWLQKKGVAHGLVAPATNNSTAWMAGAASTVLKHLYPKFADFIDDSLTSDASTDFQYGVDVGNAVIAARSNDKSGVEIMDDQIMPSAYGHHRADPFVPGQRRLGPVWGDVDHFTNAGRQAMGGYPGHATPVANLLANAKYQQDFNEVRALGSAERGARTAEQQRIGVYWGYDGANNLGVPPRLYNQVARRILLERDKASAMAGLPLLLLAQWAEVFAMINVAMADGGIDAWHYKYKYDLWRPVVGIREEAADPSGTGGDQFWAPLGAPQTNTASRSTLTPNFPAYPSGHATFGAALMQVLRMHLTRGARKIELSEVLAFDGAGGPTVADEQFGFVSDELDGVSADPDGSTRPRVFKAFRSYAEPVWENAVSRVYLGVHWRFDGLPQDVADGDVGGVPLGLKNGEAAYSFFNTAPSLAGSA